ncbi:winged helix-turn-helix transcriptional regulator [Paenibacillus fonticola]|uniref:winged helix-turn-helix transcriptional regulator n=1 Tax=Paenibacillus fonticola TaxID=379896 RepID=UPI000368FC1C|nr:response regulator transcription factor [Paenibacillus fonticola]
MEVQILSAGGEFPQKSRLHRQLKEAGYAVSVIRILDLPEGQLPKQKPDILLIEIGESGLDALSMLKEREGGYPYPILAVLLERNTQQLVSAFAAGVNDVVDGSVPFLELDARIGNLVKLFARMDDRLPNEIVFEDLRIEPKSRKVFREGQLIKLTPKEYELLVYLSKHANTVCHREDILQEVWGYDFATGTNVVDVYVRHLRKKIDRGKARKLIHTVRGTGYMMH